MLAVLMLVPNSIVYILIDTHSSLALLVTEGAGIPAGEVAGASVVGFRAHLLLRSDIMELCGGKLTNGRNQGRLLVRVEVYRS